MLKIWNERPFFGRIESVRGLGAMAVAAYHVSGWTLHGQPLLPRGADAWIPAHASLMAFFVISGFVLRVALEYGPQQFGKATGKFLLSRVFRIYPIIFLAVAVTAIFPACQVGTTGVAKFSTLQWLENFLLIDASVNSTLWALQVEMLMVPVILGLYFLERRFGPRVLHIIAIAATGLAFLPGWAWWPPLSANLFSFVLGMMIPTLGCQLANRYSRRTSNAITLLAVSALLLSGPLLGTFSLFSAIFEAYSAFVLLSILSYRSDVVVSSVMNLRVLQWLGLSTGSYYVLHMATIVPMMMLASAIVPESWVASAPVLTGLAVTATWLLLLVPICRVSYHLVEAQGIAAGKWVIRKLIQDRKYEQSTKEGQSLQRKAA